MKTYNEDKISEEGDTELHFIDDLLKTQHVLDLVARMQPLDITKVIMMQLGLMPKEALCITLNLLKNMHEMSLVPNLDMKQTQILRSPRPSGTNEWPYDANTVSIMSPKNKGNNKPIMSGFDPLDMDTNNDATKAMGRNWQWIISEIYSIKGNA